jgi:predicted dinucleotide-binding enzyme
MNITIIGTGNMARGIGTRLVAGGHHVSLLGKEPGDAEAVAKSSGARLRPGVPATRLRTT